MTKKKIAIIGGGIAGLSFARCLGTEDYELHIFEQKESFGEVGAAISVFPNALSVLDQMGLLKEVLHHSGEFKQAFLKTSGGKVLAFTEPKNEYPVVCMHRAALHKILLHSVAAVLHAGHALTGLDHLATGEVKLRFANGTETVFDAVVGADGIHSAVRRQILNDGPPIYRGYQVWRGVVDASLTIGYGSESYGPGKRVGIVPLGHGRYGWWATYNEAFGQSDEPEGAKAKLLRLFAGWHHPVEELIRNTDHIIKHPLSDRKPVRGWTQGQPTLLGDAAHPMTPNLGQGGCLAIEGAYLLARCIRKHGLTNAAFERYEQLQFPRAKMLVNESLRMGRLGQLTNPLLIGLRNLALRLTPSSITMKMIDRYFGYRVVEVEV